MASTTLRSPIQLGTLRLPNRLYRAPVLEGAGSAENPAAVYARHFVPNVKAGLGLGERGGGELDLDRRRVLRGEGRGDLARSRRLGVGGGRLVLGQGRIGLSRGLVLGLALGPGRGLTFGLARRLLVEDVRQGRRGQGRRRRRIVGRVRAGDDADADEEEGEGRHGPGESPRRLRDLPAHRRRSLPLLLVQPV